MSRAGWQRLTFSSYSFKGSAWAIAATVRFLPLHGKPTNGQLCIQVPSQVDGSGFSLRF